MGPTAEKGEDPLPKRLRVLNRLPEEEKFSALEDCCTSAGED
jgi:hypothetical protein